ncbi:MAG TPA: MFS transporter [Mesorhizobium sp.]|jgi:predicted MFS family arabinose efflux permease|nr:MFS transporter [Mesorhizobium sp.]
MDATNQLLSARRARWAVAALFLGNGFMVGSWAPHIPLLVERLRITESVLGLIILCFGIGALISMPWCGWLMARFGQRPVLRVFALAQGFGLALVVLSPSVPVAALAAVVFGATIGCTDVAMNASTVTVERRLGKAVMSSMHGFWSLGGFAGAALGGFVVQGLGALAHSVAVGVAVFILGLAILPHFLEARERPAADEQPRRGVSLPRNPTLYLLGVVALFTFVSEGAVLDWAALYLTKELGAGVAVASLAYALFAGAMALMRFAGDGIRNRFGAVPTMRASSLVAAIAMLVAAFASTPFLVIAAFAVCGLGVANTVPIAFSAAGNQPGISAGTGMSVVTTMGYAGILLAPSSIGIAGERFGFSPVFAALAFLLFVVFAMSPLVAAADMQPEG